MLARALADFHRTGEMCSLCAAEQMEVYRCYSEPRLGEHVGSDLERVDNDVPPLKKRIWKHSLVCSISKSGDLGIGFGGMPGVLHPWVKSIHA